MQFTKSSGVSGEWVDKTAIATGLKAKLVNECIPVTRDYDGKPQTQNIAKVRFQGETGEAKNLAVNRPTINALIEAYGEDSKEWIGKTLTAHTEKVIVGGKRGTALYLVPEGFSLGEDDGGYVVIKPKDVPTVTPVAPTAPLKSADEEIKYPQEEINPEDIPF
jgi:hypothetical protein